MFALGLRVWSLGTENLFYDEWFSLVQAKAPVGQTIRGAWLSTTTPLYYLILKPFVALFGDSEVALRLPSVLAGVAAVPLLASVGRRLFDRETGVMAALLLAVSSFHVYHSQAARMYSLVVFFGLLSMDFFLAGLGRRTWWTRVGYVASTTALVYANYFGGFVVLAQGTFLGFEALRDRTKRQQLRWWLAELLLVALLLAPWGRALARQVGGASKALPWIPPVTVPAVEAALRRLTGSMPLLMLLAAAFIAGCVAYRPRSDARSPLPGPWLLVTSWLLLPHLILIAFSLAFYPLYFDRYVIITLPALFLGVAAGIRAIRPVGVRWGLLVVIASVSFGNVVDVYKRAQSTQWREGVAWVAARVSGDELLMAGGAESEYYVSRDPVARVASRRHEQPGDAAGKTAWIRGFSRVWYLLPANETLPEPLAGEYKERERKEYFRVTALLLERLTPGLGWGGDGR